MSIAEKALQLKEDFDEVYEAGNKNGYNEATLKMWDAYTNKGKRERGERLFSQANFTNIEELPYPLVIKDSMYRMFYDYRGGKLPRPQYVDLSQVAPTVDTGNMLAWWSPSNDAGWTADGVFPDYGLPAMNTYASSFTDARKLMKIEILRVHETTTFSGPFNNCLNLKDITFEGVIGRSISFSTCPLSVESMKNIITHLKDYSGTTNAGKYTLTLKDSCKTEMANQGAIEEFGGKTYDQYIADIGWNLA